MAEKSDWQKNINRYLSENPDWDYRQAEKQAFIDAALQVGEASFGGLISGSATGQGTVNAKITASEFCSSS